MLPAITASPPNFLMPRRRPSVSRPLREEPPAFLCAMASTPEALDASGSSPETTARIPPHPGGGAIGAASARRRPVLAVRLMPATRSTVTCWRWPLRAAAVLPAALLEDDDLVQPVLRDHRRGDRGAGDGRRADRQAAVAADRQHVGEGDGRAGLGLQLLDLQHRVRRHPVLFSAGADHCEHRTNSQSVAGRQEARRPESGVIAAGRGVSTRLPVSAGRCTPGGPRRGGDPWRASQRLSWRR